MQESAAIVMPSFVDVKSDVVLLRALRNSLSGDPAIRDVPRVPWTYLGRDLKGKMEAKSLLGADSFVSFLDHFQETAQKLMTPYIDAVGCLGKEQKDMVGWLASKFASRSIWQTKFFHRLVAVRLALDIIVRRLLGGRYILVVEDPWVFEALRVACGGAGAPRFIGRGKLGVARYRQWISSPLKRLGLAGYAGVFRLAMSAAFLRHKRNRTQPPGGDVLLHAYVEDRTLAPDGRYRDEYLGILGGIAEESGFKVFRMTHLLFPWRLILPLARNCSLWPLILSLPYRSIMSCLFKRWRPLGLKRLEIPGIPAKALTVLLRAERIAESGAGHMYHCMTYAAYLNLLKRCRPRTIVYPFENQPWEKLLCWAVRSQGSGVRLVGFQQSTVARFFVHFFRSRWEDEGFFPDAILVGGDRFAELLASGGWDSGRLYIGGALRHVEALNAASSYLPGRTPKAGGSVIVALPVDMELTREILASLQAAFPDGGKADGIQFLVRLHPAGEDGFRSEFSDWLGHVGVDRRPYLQSLKDESIACVLTAMGASGLEALFVGLPVARFRTDLGIDIDPLDQYTGDGVCVVNKNSLRAAVLNLVQNPPRPSLQRLEVLGTYFARPDPQRVLEALLGHPE